MFIFQGATGTPGRDGINAEKVSMGRKNYNIIVNTSCKGAVSSLQLKCILME